MPGGGYESFEEMHRIERALDEKVRCLMMGALAEGDDRERGDRPCDDFASAVEAYRQAVRAALVSARRVLCEPPDWKVDRSCSPVSTYCADLASLDPVRMDNAARELCKVERYGGAVREDVWLLPHRRTYELDEARAAWVQEFYDAAVEALGTFVDDGVIGAPPTLRRPDNFEHFAEWAHQMAEDLRPWLADLEAAGARLALARRPVAEADRPVCEHSIDFTSVSWFGTKFDFTKTQAACVRLLWAEWEKQEGFCLSEATIGEQIMSAATPFRLRHVFRCRDGGRSRMHRAWGQMIVPAGKGKFGLASPKKT